MDKMRVVNTNGKKGYHPEMDGDPLHVEKGWSHFRHGGEKDFLNRILAYRLAEGGIDCQVETFRGKTTLVCLRFVGETVFRFQMFPFEKLPNRKNEVFDFPVFQQIELTEEEDFFLLRTNRVTLSIRKCPWEMTILLDGRELTREQIKDHNVDQKYKAIPTGFTVNPQGNVIDAFETMYLYCDESFYGFGEKFTDFNKRGQKITVWQRDAQSTNSNISYKGMPYFMSSAGYSILLNTYTRTHFNMGATSAVSYTMETEDAYLDYYMFCNRDYKGLIQDYTALSGRSPMIPRWAFGFWMSKMSYRTRDEVEDIAARMEAFGMSADVIHIDGWQSRGNSMGKDSKPELLAFDETRFPNPKEMIAGLREKGLHLSLWMFPYVHAVSMKPPANPTDNDKQSEQDKLLEEYEKASIALYERMKELDFLVKRPDGTPYIFSPGEGDAGGWGVAALDFTNPAFVAYIKERVKLLMKLGVGVIKTDFSEEVPEDAVFYDGSTGLEAHNKYTLLYAKTIFEASQEAKAEMGEKPLLWGRSGYAGSQNYPANWAGDSSASKNNLAAILNGGLSMGVSGVSFWGFDIGGFYNCDYEGTRTIPEDEEYIRSVQMGLMSPLSRSHGQATPREPWNYSETAQEAFLAINKLRYRLLPYLYSTAYETHLEGIPMMRAMLLEFPTDLNVRTLSTQYMLGKSLLVAPVFDQQLHHIYLPAGSWVDFYTGERIETGEGGRWITADQDIRKIPLFLRENSILPMLAEAPMHIAEEAFQKLHIVMNLTDQIEQSYYDDKPAEAASTSASTSGNTILYGSFFATLQGGKLEILPFATYFEQIQLDLSSGSKLDIFTSVSGYGPSWVNAGYLVDMAELLPEHGPDILSSYASETIANAMNMNGFVFGVPVHKEISQQPTVFFRTDILEKHNLDVSNIKSLADLDALYEKVSALEPGMWMLAADNVGSAKSIVKDSVGGTAPAVILDPVNSTTVVNEYETDEFYEWCSYNHKWFTKGWINSGAASDAESYYSYIKSGQAFSFFSDYGHPLSEADQENNCGGVDLTMLAMGEPYATTTTSAVFGYSIAAGSENPVKAMQMLNLIMSDTEIMNLLNWGEEGTDYIVNNDGLLEYPEGKDLSSVGYHLGAGWILPNQFMCTPWATDGADIYDRIIAYNESSIISKAMGFTFNPDSVSDEMAAITNVKNKYFKALIVGAVDPDEYIPILNEELKQAGIDTVVAEVQRQLDEFLAQ